LIDKKLASLYRTSEAIDSKAKINYIDREITNQSERMYKSINSYIDSLKKNPPTGDMMYGKSLSILGAGGSRVHQIIEDRLKNRIVDLFSLKDVDKSLQYFLDGNNNNNDDDYNPTNVFTPNLMQTQKLMQSIYNEGFEDILFTTVLTEDFIMGLTEKTIDESYINNIYTPVRTVTYKEVTKDPIEYILPAYTKGRSLLYGSAEIDMDQFKTRKVGEPI
jgi:hypothetical protein